MTMGHVLYLVRHGEQVDAQYGVADGPLSPRGERQARLLGLLKREKVDWQAAEELTANLRLLDPNDPVKYDFALFGEGVA